jgi:hypothetical protein
VAKFIVFVLIGKTTWFGIYSSRAIHPEIITRRRGHFVSWFEYSVLDLEVFQNYLLLNQDQKLNFCTRPRGVSNHVLLNQYQNSRGLKFLH